MVKLFDSTVLEEQLNCIFTGLLQFAYWMLLKPLISVEYMKLVNTLGDRKVCPLVLRLLMNMYINEQD